MRSHGRVRFIKVTTRMQVRAAAVAGVLALAWLAAMVGAVAMQFGATREQIALAKREARVAVIEDRVADVRRDVSGMAADLERRQDFLERAIETLDETPAGGDDAADAAPGTTPPVLERVSSAGTKARGFAAIEARQLALAEALTSLAERRSAAAERAIRRVGLNPGMMIAKLDRREGRGGPLVPALGRGGKVDPRFARLGESLARMSALEQGLEAIPTTAPGRIESISSGFGYRSDPFTGEAALHAGLDFAGPIGAPIHAAAKGSVIFAGVRSGYGNMVEISHGNGLTTRYAHMSRIATQVGQAVEPGEIVGAIGNTGRSTGPHLHFEVRINDRAVNPRPFLQAQGR